jgi:type IX secretion system PorP/SprF family membrane protein
MKDLCSSFLYFRKCICVIAIVFLTKEAQAQKEVQFSQFFFNQVFFNPATSGKDSQTRLTAVYRSQYTGYQPTNSLDKGGAPTSQLISASLPFGKFGVGFYAVNDQIGALAQQDIQLSAAYKVVLPSGVLSLGARGGIYRQSLDYDQLRPENSAVDDPLFLSGVVSEIQPDVSIGLHYESEAFYTGVSATHLTKPKFALGSTDATNPLATAYYFQAGAYLSLGYQLEVQPVLLAKMVPGVVSAEGGALLTFDRRFFGGVTYRHQDVVGIFHAGAYLLSDQSLRLSGAYDWVIRGNKAKTPTSFEVMLSYAFGQQKGGAKSIIRTPRFRF